MNHNGHLFDPLSIEIKKEKDIRNGFILKYKYKDIIWSEGDEKFILDSDNGYLIRDEFIMQFMNTVNDRFRVWLNAIEFATE